MNPVFTTVVCLLISLPAMADATGVLERDGRISRIYGPALAQGTTPRASAQAFVEQNAETLGVEATDLAPIGPFADGRHLQPIMPDARVGDWVGAGAGAFKFTGVYYRHVRDGVPVFRSRVMLLARNAADHPIVLVANGLRPIGEFRPPRGAAATDTVIFAGAGDDVVPPVLARVHVVETARPHEPGYSKQLFVVDATKGTILHTEDLVHRVDVSGNVSGLATQGLGPDVCGPEAPEGMPYARVQLAGKGIQGFADGKGDFVLPFEGTEEVDVVSTLDGRWFHAVNHAGPNARAEVTVTPPGPANLLHNADNDEEFNRAEVNAYLHANIIRRFALDQNFDYPVIATQEGFTVNVNINSTCGAHYSGDAINFFRAGVCANAAYSTIVYHEYGHHVIASGGSGQGAYGEGMADALGVLITDDPGLAHGFVGACDEPARTADNEVQYPCDGPKHECGGLISGCVWDTRNELAATHPDDYREILSLLAVNAILLHVGESITPAITIDYLTLDDDDGDLSNGTPHYCEIATGFGAHNMDAPPVECDIDVDGNGVVDFDDLLRVLDAWGPCEDCPEDINGDDQVDFSDLLLILGSWGTCGC